MINLTGKTVLVTGGAKRLGSAIARLLSQRGARIVVHYRSAEAEANALVRAIRDESREAWCLPADLMVQEEVEALMASAWSVAGGIDCLVNNASIFPEGGLDALDLQSLLPNVKVNALAPFVMARKMADRGNEGAVVNLLDTRITDYDSKHVPYHLSKRMLFSLTRMMAVEYAPRLRVNAVAPGLVLPPAGKDETYLADLAHTNPLECYGNADDVAEAVAFLLSSNFVTGQTIFVDGGRHLRGSMYAY